MNKPCVRPEETSAPNYSKFIFGGLAGMAAAVFVQPAELIKTWMQLSGEGAHVKHTGTMSIMKEVVATKGVLGLWQGLSAGLFRQATYTTTRIGVYSYLFDKCTGPDGEPPSFGVKVLLGMAAGAVGGVVGTPAEVCLIRMSSDGKLPPEKRRNYTGLFNAIATMAKKDGFTSLWRGVGPTVARSIVVNIALLSSYSQVKQMMSESSMLGKYMKEDGVPLYFCSSMIAGLAATAVSLPVDIAKTRIQSQKTSLGPPNYKNTADVLIRVVKEEGFLSLWKGFTPQYARLGPHTVLTYIFFEQMIKLYQNFCEG